MAISLQTKIEDLQDIQYEESNYKTNYTTIIRSSLFPFLLYGVLFLLFLLFIFIIIIIIKNSNKYDIIKNVPKNITEILKSHMYDATFPYLPADNKKMTAIRDEMAFAWNEYRKYAWGYDFLLPVSKKGKNKFNGGISIIDSLDTLILMNLTEEYTQSYNWILENFSLIHTQLYSIFEITIRELGGLLSAYELTQEKLFLDKATLLGDSLSQAFLSTGLFSRKGAFKDNNLVMISDLLIYLSDLGSIQLEFDKLSYHTKNTTYSYLASKAHDTIFRMYCNQSIYPSTFFVYDAHKEDDTYSFDSNGDSFYEYLIKLYILSNGTSKIYFQHYLDSISEMKNKLLYKTKQNTFLISKQHDFSIYQMSHFAAFISGTLAIGSVKQNPYKQEDLEIAHNIVMTFIKLSKMTSSGLVPQLIQLDIDKKNKVHIEMEDPSYNLRPELVESLFILYRFTGKKIYRKEAWNIFKRIRRICRIKHGYGNLIDTNRRPFEISNFMDSYFLAETLKYLYLIFTDSTFIPLSRYVFNTEAHPFEIMSINNGYKYVPLDTIMKNESKCLNYEAFSNNSLKLDLLRFKNLTQKALHNRTTYNISELYYQFNDNDNEDDEDEEDEDDRNDK